MSRRRPWTASWFRNGRWASPGEGRRHASKGECGTGETLPGGLRRAKTGRIRRELKSPGAGRESEGSILPMKAGRTRRREGTLLRSRLRWREARGHGREAQQPLWQSARTPAQALRVRQAEQDTAFPRAVRPDLGGGGGWGGGGGGGGGGV